MLPFCVHVWSKLGVAIPRRLTIISTALKILEPFRDGVQRKETECIKMYESAVNGCEDITIHYE